VEVASPGRKSAEEVAAAGRVVATAGSAAVAWAAVTEDSGAARVEVAKEATREVVAMTGTRWRWTLRCTRSTSCWR